MWYVAFFKGMTISIHNALPSVRVALSEAERVLVSASVASPRLAAEWLLSAVLDMPRLQLHVYADRTLDEAQQALMATYTARAARHEPIQYIVGETEFMGLRIVCDPRALIPRPETEVLVALIRDDLRAGAWAEPVIVDVGTGTGCLGLALADALPGASVIAVDVDESALSLARENAERLGLSDRVVFQSGDLLTGFAAAVAQVVAANLPYIATAEWEQLPVDVRDFEPRRALDGGASGLELIERLTRQAATVLCSGGRLYLEIGADQGASARAILESAAFANVAIHPDWTGRDRIVRGIKP